jgi:hypothetical protein
MHKAAYVRRMSQLPDNSGHHCHWPECNKPVPPAMWGCKTHWFKLPMRLRNRIFAAYRPGQEISKTPSAAYIAVAQEAQAWIAESLGKNAVSTEDLYRDSDGTATAAINEDLSVPEGLPSAAIAQTQSVNP